MQQTMLIGEGDGWDGPPGEVRKRSVIEMQQTISELDNKSNTG